MQSAVVQREAELAPSIEPEGDPWTPAAVATPGAGRIALAVAAVLLVLALALRIGYVEARSYSPTPPARAYLQLGAQVAQTGDYSRLQPGLAGSVGPTAYRPPAFPYLLGAVDRLDGHPPTGAAAARTDRVVDAVLGAIGVILIGAIALELVGIVAALLALGLAAVYPPLIELSGTVGPESLLLACGLGAVFAALRAHRSRDSVPWLIAGGVLVGLAGLTAERGLLLAVPLAIGVRGARATMGRRGVRAPGILLVAMLFTLSPWLIRDWAQTQTLIPVSDGTGVALRGTYNPSSATATKPPDQWLAPGLIPADRSLLRHAGGMTEPQLDRHLTGRALAYIADHPLSPLEVGAHNLLRLLELEGPAAWHASSAAAGISSGTAQAGVIGFWILAILAAVGAMTNLARRTPRWVWGIPATMALVAMLLDGSTPQGRLLVDPFLVVLAACALRPLVGIAHRRYLEWHFAAFE
jgi:hypothetical protein